MATEPLLDFDALTAPISGADPAGAGTPFTVRNQLDEARKELDPSTFAPDDPMRPSEFQRADWGLIIRLAQDSLRNNAKDLLVAARLVEALVKVHGFAGLRDGLKLLTLLVRDCWERLYPKIDDPSDLDLRTGPFEWLDDPDRGGRFPSSIRLVPILEGASQSLSWQDWKRAQETQNQAILDAFEKAVLAASLAECHAKATLLESSRHQLDELTGLLNQRLGELAPGLLQLRKAIDDCRGLLTLILQRKGTSLGEAESKPTEAGNANAPLTPAVTAAQTSASVANRDFLYQQIADIAAHLERLEPHSPVPYLLRRAVAVGKLPFPEMIKNFVRDRNVLEEMARELALPRTEES